MSREIVVSDTEFSFSPSAITVNAGERVRIIFTNMGSVSHNLVIDQLGVSTPIIGPGQSANVTFTANQAGTFEFYCSVTGHKGFGMVGQLTVS